MAFFAVIMILAIIALYFYIELEKAEDYIFILEDRPYELREENKKLKLEKVDLKESSNQAEARAIKHFETLQKIRTAVFQEQNYGSVENLQNKIKTILDDSNSSNIK